MTDVSQTFEQNEILLTGANGFLGKVVLGMLLDRAPDFKHLHVLTRPGRDLGASERFHDLTLRSPALAPIVDSLSEKRGQEFLGKKLTVWVGDIGQPNCGLRGDDLERLAGRVRVMINCAGLVDFFPPVDAAFRSNVEGVEHVVSVAKGLGAKLVHISTCFVCGEADGLVEETEPILGFYPHRKGPEDTAFLHTEEIQYTRERIRQIYDSDGTNGNGPSRPDATDDANSAARSQEVARRLVALGKQRAEQWGWVNTYTYSKSLGEQIIAAEPGLDYALVRPAIIESALRFPFPGWIEGGRTAAPLVLMALGGLKDWPVREDIPLEIVPVDLVAAAILAVSALILNGHRECVYQLGSADVNPILLGPIVNLLDAESRRARSNRRHRAAGLALVDPPSRIRFLSVEKARARRLRLQRRIDRAEVLLAGTRKMLERTKLPGRQLLAGWGTALRTLSLQAAFREQTLDQYLPFILHNRYTFESENIRAAYSLLSEKDREVFPWDPERIDWKEYWINQQVKGTQKWIQPEAVREWAFKI